MIQDWWLVGVVVACVGAFAVFRAGRQWRRRRRRLDLLVAWHACVAGIALVGALADVERGVSIGIGLAAVGGLTLIGLGALLADVRPRRVAVDRSRDWPLGDGAGLASRHLRTAAAWSLPLAFAVAALLDLAAAFPPGPVIFYVVVLTLVGAWFTDSHAVLSVGLRCAVAATAAAVFSVVVPTLDAAGARLETLATSASWAGGAVLLFGSTLVRRSP